MKARETAGQLLSAADSLILLPATLHDAPGKALMSALGAVTDGSSHRFRKSFSEFAGHLQDAGHCSWQAYLLDQVCIPMLLAMHRAWPLSHDHKSPTSLLQPAYGRDVKPTHSCIQQCGRSAAHS